jgi:hypothetical protein
MPQAARQYVLVNRTAFSQDTADAILNRLAAGESLAAITKDAAMPAAATVYKWLLEHASFAESYARARTTQADAKFDAISDITQQVLRGEIDPHAGRVAIDAYKWQAGKLRPSVYGEKIEHVVRSGNAADLTDDELARIALASAPTLLLTTDTKPETDDSPNHNDTDDVR